jgi:hypothetical protein
MLAGEHALYEAVHKSKGNDAGKDAFYEGQDLVWVEDTLDNNEIIKEIQQGMKRPMHRTKCDDRNTLESLHQEDTNKVKHRWWIPPPDKTACLVHFVKECYSNGSDPLEVLAPSASSLGRSGKDEGI